jgi:hypothetical protein
MEDGKMQTNDARNAKRIKGERVVLLKRTRAAGRMRHSVLLLYVKISNRSLSWAAALGLTGGLLAGCASPSHTQEQPGRELTGSYIPQNVQQKGPITNGGNPVNVRDQSDLQRSGGATPGQVLRQLGEIH